MQTRPFGRAGFDVTLCGVGTWAMGSSWGPQDDEDSRAALHAALDLGCRFIDTAQSYGEGRSEALVAQVLRDRGERVPVATKVPPKNRVWGPPASTRIEECFPLRYVVERCEESLRRLRTDCLDLYQLHTWQREWGGADDWREARERLMRQGKIRAFGISLPDGEPDAADDILADGLVDAVQVVYNILDQEARRRLLPLAQKHGVAVIARVPLASGLLSGHFRADRVLADGDWRGRYFRGPLLEKLLKDVAAAQAVLGRDLSLSQAALRFAGADPAVATVIPGARTARQAQENTQAFLGPELPAAVLEELYALSTTPPPASPSDYRYRGAF